MSLAELNTAARPFGLFVMGALHEEDQTLALLGAGAGLWPQFLTSDECCDGAPDPLDRWSKRVLGGLARDHDATALFPSDGPPYAPFIRWAMETGHFFQSPTGMMVHPTAGLMISIRGALKVPQVWALDLPPAENPCLACVDRPCVTACPVGALSDDHDYDVPACKAFLDTSPGKDCMTQGCRVRRACPVSQSFQRDPAQSAFHMRSFKG
jgi:hypothetical protein